jgi:hypothetical protein
MATRYDSHPMSTPFRNVGLKNARRGVSTPLSGGSNDRTRRDRPPGRGILGGGVEPAMKSSGTGNYANPFPE